MLKSHEHKLQRSLRLQGEALASIILGFGRPGAE